jgi:hypothetical protein
MRRERGRRRHAGQWESENGETKEKKYDEESGQGKGSKKVSER